MRLHPSLSVYRQLVVDGGRKATLFSNVVMSKVPPYSCKQPYETAWVIKDRHEIKEFAVM